ncbi:probable E3 ubiquitin-protein ligase HERC4 isoform X1 [Drosophila innubila]|uniref:probable E3 ubiquitin-protein ligase HERC4 isoform X1 n=1 Tax=Drosophila innubila TaxID=198719 RepID=UPI00148D1C5D|nr:probable E3 ubiquitin-protein ligase HERC4 isoform X1 [Drosophila innubila]XP_034481051.1 probable E3 ubiquitin-protein ligase HERC4 isoform X1 [Drosophila innubila]
MDLYCWGNTSRGQLGLGGIEDEQILVPSKIPWQPDSAVQQIACGHRHTLFLTSSGKVYACGSNDYSQLGHELPTKRPRMSPFLEIPELQAYVVTQIACGSRHSMALTEWGQVLSWGDNECGQLGHASDQEIIQLPKIVRYLVSKTVVQIACGNNHSLALTCCGELYSWGSNIYGQLGVKSPNELQHCNYPMRLTTLLGIPVAAIACGGNHSFLISKSTAVFGWGRNNCGQLGLNDETNRAYPTQLKTLRTLGVRFVACGDEYSVFLTNEGGVFTCGAGAYGQLGHGFNSNEMLPRMVVELMGSTISQVACGNRHTLALVPSRGRIYGFGLGSSGQLGTRNTKSLNLPQMVIGPWVSPSGSALLQSSDAEVSVVIQQIFSGGDQSIVTTSLYVDKKPPADCRIYEPKSQILALTADATKQCARFKEGDQSDLDLLHSMEQIFKSQACLNGSFLLSQDQHFGCSARNYGLDLAAAQLAFDNLRKVENQSIKQVIWDNLTKDLLGSLVPSPADVESMRLYLLLPLYHEFVNSKHYKTLHVPFALATFKLTDNPRKVLEKWWSHTPSEYFEQMVNNFLHVVMHIISFKMGIEVINHNEPRQKKLLPNNKDLEIVLRLLDNLCRVNNLREDRLSYQLFHWPDLMDYVDVQQEYFRWTMFESTNDFNICNYPFLFDASAKTALLQADQLLQMHSAMANSFNAFHDLLGFGQISQFIVLNVTRENIVQDSLRELQLYSQSDLKKPLKIKFHGEEAVDAGGVRKEFFMLLLKDLIDPKYGMFKEFEDSRIMWFADVSFETENMYFLVGVLCGLAIYNFTIINLPFPLALYKKLLEKPVDLSDLREMSPTEANSMQALLDYEGDDFKETFDLTFEISRDVFGESETKSLKPNGSNIAVTLENRQEFVDLYVDFIFNQSVELHYRAFHKGFMRVCSGRVLKIFQPEELMAVVVGNEEYDWQALEDNCDYKEGYTSGDETVKWFWEVFHDLSEDDKKKFLLYLTGSDRIPIQGMKAIKIIIQPTQNERFLPVAHTCFNLLDLPRYKTKERLKFKLLQAIQQTQGFSLI